MEKKKSELISVFEKVLQEHTPCRSISEPSTLVEYLQNLTLKSEMQNEELRRISGELNTAKALAEKSLQERDSLKVELESTKLEKPEDEAQTKELKQMNEDLSSAVNSAKEELKSLSASFELEKKRSEALEAEVKSKDEQTISITNAEAKMREEMETKLTAVQQQQKTQITQLTNKLQESVDANETATRLLDERSKSNDVLETQLKNTTEELDSLKEKRDNFDKEIKSLSRINELYQKKIREQNEEIAGYKEQINEKGKKSNEITPFEEEKEPTNPSISTPSKKKKKKGKAGLNSQNIATKSSEQIGSPTLVSVSNEHADKELVKRLESENEALKSKERELTTQLNSEKEEISSLRDMLKDVGQDLVNSQENLKNEQYSKVETENKVLKQLEKESKELEDKLADLGKSHKDLQVENKELKAELDKVVSERTSLLEKVKDLESQSKTKVAELEKLINAAKAEASSNQLLAQERFKEISNINEANTKLQSSLKPLQRELEENKGFKDQVSKRQEELKRQAAVEKNLRAEISTLTSIIADKDDSNGALKAQLEASESARQKSEGRITQLRQTGQRLESEKRTLSDQNEKLKQSLDRIQRDYETAINNQQNWEAEKSKVIAELGQLKGMSEANEAQKIAASNIVETLRRQSEEVSMRLVETTTRCDTLEEELAEAHKHLQERIREASTMRKLLSESEGGQEDKLREATEKIRALTFERDRFESDAIELGKRRHRDVEDLKSKLRETEQITTTLQDEKSRLNRELADLKASRDRADEKAQLSDKEVGESRGVISQLRETLTDLEVRLRETEAVNQSLRQLADDNREKMDKLQKNQRTLGHDLNALQLERNRLESQLKINGSKGTGHSSSESSPRPSLSGSISSTTQSGQPNMPYIKNVLLGFFEHKDQRQRLLPVISTVLDLQGSEEKRFWAAIQK